MRKRKYKRGKRAVSLLLSVLMIAGSIPVQASEFGAPVAEADLFSSGVEECLAENADAFVSGSASDLDPSTDLTLTPTPIQQPEATPQPSVTPVPSETPLPTETPAPTGTPAPTETPILTVTPTPEATPTPVPDVNWQEQILIRFLDGEGKECEALDPMVVKWGESLTLPHVPDQAAPDQWKLTAEEQLNDEDCFKFAGGESLTLDQGESWENFIEKDEQNPVPTLSFYMPKKCTVTFWNNSGTATFPTLVQKVYETNITNLPDPGGTKYVNYGWTLSKGSTNVNYGLNSVYTVTQDINLYIVRRTALQVTFYSQTGVTNSTFRALEQTIGKGLNVTLPEVPNKTGYQALGWSLTKKSTSADHAAGKQVKVSKAMTFYAVYKKLPYTVTFDNNSGTSTSKVYKTLKTYAAKNQKITLPEVPKASGYVNLGWTTEKGKSTPLYEAGSQVKITKSTKFYAVRRKSKYYTINYYLGNGKTNSTYKKLSQTVEEGTQVTFASVPVRIGYVNLGWSSKKNSTKATAKPTCTINKNINLYAVQKEAVILRLYKANGTLWRSVTLAKGTSYELPNVSNATGYTFMGWSSQEYLQQNVNYRSSNPEYEAEDSIVVNEDMELYAVVFNHALEMDIPEVELPQVDFYKYKQVIFVGDSRTEYMQNALKNLGGNSTPNVEFVCEAGRGLSWLQSTGFNQLYSMVRNDTNSLLSRKTAVIFNFGVNDLKKYKEYVTYYNFIEPSLTNKGCELYFMSVNPVNRKMLASAGKSDRSEAAVRSFNAYLKENLSSSYSYIDMYSYLKMTGYSFNSDHAGIGGIDDGLHYTAKTYKRIFTKCLTSLKRR